MTAEEACRALRANPATAALPIVFLIERGRTAELKRIIAFEIGADDCVTKPFNLRELVLRVEALLRRTRGSMDARNRGVCTNGKGSAPALDSRKLIETFGPFHIDRLRREVSLAGQRLVLPAKEYQLLQLLIDHRGLPVPRQQLLAEIWDYHGPPAETRTLDTHVRRLRVKLGAYSTLVVTMRARGYRLSATSVHA